MVNKVILIGNLGQDPEVRFAQNGTQITTFSVATTESWTNKEGVREDQTEWHRIVTFANLAKTCGDYLSKGSKVYIEGQLRTQKWEDREGNPRKTTEIVARVVKFLSPKGSVDQNQGSGYGQEEPPLPDIPQMEDDVPF
ncbi:MAG: single-stranded DNA-binding protein [Desulfobacterales bacterium SG8_35]|nr:MAG: single-stranded DNA-binding protein [Desulfobacterales bacterium SG8_35]